MDPETLARTIAQRQIQIEQLSRQLLESLNKIKVLESELKQETEQKLDLIKKLEKKSVSIKQETEDIEILKAKINSFQTKTWGDVFWGIKSWVGSKMPYGSSVNSTKK